MWRVFMGIRAPLGAFLTPRRGTAIDTDTKTDIGDARINLVVSSLCQ
jgi:hypothetical protein